MCTDGDSTAAAAAAAACADDASMVAAAGSGSGSSVGAPLSTGVSPLPVGRATMSQSTSALPSALMLQRMGAPRSPDQQHYPHAPPPSAFSTPPSLSTFSTPPPSFHYVSSPYPHHDQRCHSTPPVPVSCTSGPPSPGGALWAAASQDQFASLLQRLSTSSDGSRGSMPPSATNVAQAPTIYGGIETLAEIRGCEVYHYRMFGTQVRPQRLEGLHSFEQLSFMGDVRTALETHVNPERPAGGNTLCINGPRGSGIATAVHLHCRNRGINLIDCHNTVGLNTGWDWTLLQRIQNTTEPYVLMMHRFDTLWVPQHRYETMGALVDRWSSLARMSPGLVRSLVWVTSLGGPEHVYPPYAQEFPRVQTYAVDLYHWSESDVAELLGSMLARYGYPGALAPDELATVAQRTDVLHSPGRVHDLVVAVTSAQTVSAPYIQRVVEQMRKGGLLSVGQ